MWEVSCNVCFSITEQVASFLHPSQNNGASSSGRTHRAENLEYSLPSHRTLGSGCRPTLKRKSQDSIPSQLISDRNDTAPGKSSSHPTELSQPGSLPVPKSLGQQSFTYSGATVPSGCVTRGHHSRLLNFSLPHRFLLKQGKRNQNT